MFCQYCGATNEDGSVFCMSCGAKIGEPQTGQPQMGQPGMGQPQMGMPRMGQPQMNQSGIGQPQAAMRPGGGIRTIFHAISSNPTRGDIMEFVVWIGLCLAAVLEMVAAVMCSVSGGAMALWIFMMLGNLGLAAILIFRLRPIYLLSAYGLFNFILLIPFYKLGADINGALDSASPIIIILFVFDLLVAIALVTLSCIQFFSRFRFDTVLVVLSNVSAALTLILIICTRYVIPGGGAITSVAKGFAFSVVSYLFGGFTYLLTLALTAFYTIMFFKGDIDSSKATIVTAGGGGGGGVSAKYRPMAVFEKGFNAGGSVPVSGKDMIVGSEPGSAITVYDGNVSPRHCVLRYNKSSGYFEMCDISQTGTFVNGQPLPKNQFVSLQKGTVVQLGSDAQCIRLV